MSNKTKPDKWVDKLERHRYPIGHIKLEDIKKNMPEELVDNFLKWMIGKGVHRRYDGKVGIFNWDFELWKEVNKI